MKMTQKELDKILAAHEEWVASAGQNGARADLRGANLLGANLLGADLCGADLSEADLQGADLTNVKLEGPELLGVDWLYHATVPARFLPWLSSHPHFADWFPTLTIVEE